MPLVKVEIIKGKSSEYKKQLLDSIHRCLIETLNIPLDDRTQRLIEYDKENFILSSDKTDKYTIVELTIFKGRGIDVKRRLYESMFNALKKDLMIEPSDIIIYINEPTMENWGIRGMAVCDIDLGFEVEI